MLGVAGVRAHGEAVASAWQPAERAGDTMTMKRARVSRFASPGSGMRQYSHVHVGDHRAIAHPLPAAAEALDWRWLGSRTRRSSVERCTDVTTDILWRAAGALAVLCVLGAGPTPPSPSAESARSAALRVVLAAPGNTCGAPHLDQRGLARFYPGRFPQPL
jgi:hypothetical protein